MLQPGPASWTMPLVPFHFTLVQNIKRDPFEQNVGIDQKSAMSMGGVLGAPNTAFLNSPRQIEARSDSLSERQRSAAPEDPPRGAYVS